MQRRGYYVSLTRLGLGITPVGCTALRAIVSMLLTKALMMPSMMSTNAIAIMKFGAQMSIIGSVDYSYLFFPEIVLHFPAAICAFDGELCHNVNIFIK